MLQLITYTMTEFNNLSKQTNKYETRNALNQNEYNAGLTMKKQKRKWNKVKKQYIYNHTADLQFKLTAC